VKATRAPLPASPSKTLVNFANQIVSPGRGLVVDAPCGDGRNSIELAGHGSAVIAIDHDRKRLETLDRIKSSHVREHARGNVSPGQVFTVCADLSSKGWPLAPSSVWSIVCVHFAMTDLIPSFLSSLKTGGYLYVETFGGHGENFRELPKSNQLRELLSTHVEFRYYKERKVGPLGFDSVAVTLLGQRRSE
jgi:SAM-dependent methyltransferase